MLAVRSSFIFVLLIGIVAGVVVHWGFRRSSAPSQQFTGGRRAEITSALVGDPSAFAGFHVAALIFTAGEPTALFLGAIVEAVQVLWGWRAFRL